MVFPHNYAVTIDDAILSILKSGRNTILAKINSAFCLLPIHPGRPTSTRDKVERFDHCNHFSLQSALKLFNILADCLAWIAQNTGVW